MLVPSPKWLDTGSNAWQMAAATFVGLQSVPGLVILYGGIVKRKWAINSAFMAMYAFAAVMVVWVLWAYNMSFGEQWFPFWGKPQPALSAGFMLQQATIPAAASGMPPLAFPMATMMFFQFVFAAITVIILAGSLIGRMSFKAWMIFVPVWMTFVYTVGCVQHLGWRLARRHWGRRFLRRLRDPSRRRHLGLCRRGGDRAAHPAGSRPFPAE